MSKDTGPPKIHRQFHIGLPKVHKRFCFGPPKMHGRFRIGLSKTHKRFHFGPPKMHRRFCICPPQVSLDLLPPEFNRRGILLIIAVMKGKQQKNLFEIE